MASNLPCRKDFMRQNRHIGLAPQLIAGPLCSPPSRCRGLGYESTAIEVPADQVRLDVYRNKRQMLNCEGRLRLVLH